MGVTWRTKFLRVLAVVFCIINLWYSFSIQGKYSSLHTQTISQRKVKQEKHHEKHALAFMYPPGLIGGYRNQAMRFIAFLKYAIDNEFDQLLLPTLMWNTKYNMNKHNMSSINPVVNSWPVPFDELFDVEHWNSFHQHHPHHPHYEQQYNENSTKNNANKTSLPLLVSSIENDIENNNDTTCWQPTNNGDIITVAAIQKNGSYNSTFSKDFLPLLTYRMLFDGNDDGGDNNLINNSSSSSNFNSNSRRRPNTFVLDLLQNQTIEYLIGNKMATKFRRINFNSVVQNCTRPHVYNGGAMHMWSKYMGMNKRAPGVLPENINDDDHDDDHYNDHDDPLEQRLENQDQRRHRRLNQMPYKNDEAAQQDTKLVKTFGEALIPAKPWRDLADMCVKHHLSLNNKVNGYIHSHGHGHRHGYIALHPRIEPEMMLHKCGKSMARNLTNMLNMVEAFASDYNSYHPSSKSNNISSNSNRNNNSSSNNNNTKAYTTTDTNSRSNSNYISPISDQLRKRIRNRRRPQPLKGTFVAVDRDEMQNFATGSKDIQHIAKLNWDTLNHRSVSYDNEGNELFTSSLLSRYQQDHQPRQQIKEQNYNSTIPAESHSGNESPLPIFECGEGWVEYAFYKNQGLQRKLFTPSSSLDEKDNLYHRYGPDNNGKDLLPLPINYYGDILPSMINFWLAVRADIFVGVMKSSWSNDVWTTRYYQGKGDRNFQITSDKGIIAVESNGLPPPHSNC